MHHVERIQSSSERDKTIVGAAGFMANRSNDDGNHLVPAIFYDERSPLCRTHAQPSAGRALHVRKQ